MEKDSQKGRSPIQGCYHGHHGKPDSRETEDQLGPRSGSRSGSRDTCMLDRVHLGAMVLVGGPQPPQMVGSTSLGNAGAMSSGPREWVGMGDPGPSQHQHLTRPRQSGIQNGLTHVNLACAEDALAMGCHQQQLNSDGSSGTGKWEGAPLNTSEPWMQETTCVFNLCQVPLIHEKQRGGQAGRRKSSGLVLHLL